MSQQYVPWNYIYLLYANFGDERPFWLNSLLFFFQNEKKGISFTETILTSESLKCGKKNLNRGLNPDCAISTFNFNSTVAAIGWIINAQDGIRPLYPHIGLFTIWQIFSDELCPMCLFAESLENSDFSISFCDGKIPMIDGAITGN